MKTALTLLVTVLLINSSFSQPVQPDQEIQAKMAELAFIVGDWKGDGWMMREGGKAEFNQTEKIQFKLDSTIIVIEGLGMTNGRVIHNAYAIISYNKEESEYSFRSYLPNGQNKEFKAELIDNKLH